MTEEEKKAIKGLEWSQKQMRLGNLPDYDQGHYADIRVVLNLIEKQQKLIEECDSGEVITENQMRWVEDNFISKDKIREKIEELDSIYQQEIKQQYNGRYYLQLSYAIQELKSLLKE